MEPLERRLEVLEARLASHRTGLRLLGLSWLAAMALGAWRGPAAGTQEVQDVLRVRSLMVVNQDGKVVCLLDAGEHGGRIMVRDNVNLRAVGAFHASEQGGSLWLASKALPGRPQCALGVDEHGGVVQVMNERRTVANLLAAEHGGYVGVVSEDGARAVDIGCLSEERGEVVVYDREGRRVLEAHADEDGEGRLIVQRNGRIDVRDRSGGTALALGAPQGHGIFNVYHPDGSVALAAGASADGQSASVAFGRLDDGFVSHIGYREGTGGFLFLGDGFGSPVVTAGVEDADRGLRVHGNAGAVVARMSVRGGGDGTVEVMRRAGGPLRLGE